MPSPRSLAPESEHRPACLPAWDIERHMAFEMELVGTCTAFLSPTRHVQAIWTYWARGFSRTVPRHELRRGKREESLFESDYVLHNPTPLLGQEQEMDCSQLTSACWRRIKTANLWIGLPGEQSHIGLLQAARRHHTSIHAQLTLMILETLSGRLGKSKMYQQKPGWATNAPHR